jgi:hypothetical protein
MARDNATADGLLLGSDTNLGTAGRFYLSDRPSTLDVLDPTETPSADDKRIARQGIALVCAVEEIDCMKAADALASRRGEQADRGRNRAKLSRRRRRARPLFNHHDPAAI